MHQFIVSICCAQMLSCGPNKLDNSANNFERAATDTFIVKGKDVGELKRVQVSALKFILKVHT